MKDRNELMQSVTNAVARALGRAPESLSEQTRLIGDLGAASVDFLDIAFEMEKAVGREIHFLDILNHVRTLRGSGTADLSVSDIVDYLSKTA